MRRTGGRSESKSGAKPRPQSGSNRFRIIGGQWRGRRLSFPDVAAIRPTPDRVRETLFNWLQPHILGARCLDLFAGSGAVGLEALSRGAATVTFVEQERPVAEVIRQHMQLLNGSGTVVEQEALSFLKRESASYDLLFLDPPFGKGLIAEVSRLLEKQGLIHANSLIYIESEQPVTAEELPCGFEVYREKWAGQVWYGLARFSEAES